MTSHLHDDTISMAIDGIADVDALTHLASCQTCTRRKFNMESARTLRASHDLGVSAGTSAENTTSLDPARRQAMLSNAVRAYQESASSRWHTNPRWLSAAAAVILLIAVSPVVISRLSLSSQGKTTDRTAALTPLDSGNDISRIEGELQHAYESSGSKLTAAAEDTGALEKYSAAETSEQCNAQAQQSAQKRNEKIAISQRTQSAGKSVVAYGFISQDPSKLVRISVYDIDGCTEVASKSPTQ